jgi:hypothetical protein
MSLEKEISILSEQLAILNGHLDFMCALEKTDRAKQAESKTNKAPQPKPKPTPQPKPTPVYELQEDEEVEVGELEVEELEVEEAVQKPKPANKAPQPAPAPAPQAKKALSPVPGTPDVASIQRQCLDIVSMNRIENPKLIRCHIGARSADRIVA